MDRDENMSKAMQAESMWHEEIESKGLRQTLADRLRFHGGLDVKTAVESTGACITTIQRHFRAMSENGIGFFDTPEGDHLKPA